DPIAEFAVVFEKPTADAERKRHLVLGFDPASKDELCSGLALFNGHGANWTGDRSRCFRLTLTGPKQRRSDQNQHPGLPHANYFVSVADMRRHGLLPVSFNSPGFFSPPVDR